MPQAIVIIGVKRVGDALGCGDITGIWHVEPAQKIPGIDHVIKIEFKDLPAVPVILATHTRAYEACVHLLRPRFHVGQSVTILTEAPDCGRQSNKGSTEPIKLLGYFESDQVYDFWLIQPKIILI